MTVALIPFPTLQLFDAMGIPMTPSLFWETPSGQIVWNILQSFPFAHFIFQPLLIECNWRRGVSVERDSMKMELLQISANPQLAGTNGHCVAGDGQDDDDDATAM